VRLFVAIPLPTEIADRAAACLPPALPAIRPVRPELMHITLAFLGWLADERLDAASEAVRAAAVGRGPFELTLDHAGRFPASGRPRAVWLGVGDGEAELIALAEATAAELRRRSFTLEDRRFAPHLTLARVQREVSGAEARTIAGAVEALTIPELRIAVDRIAVVESRLSPKGPRYTTRAEIPL
jgi:2'-5' RNA ligase